VDKVETGPGRWQCANSMAAPVTSSPKFDIPVLVILASVTVPIIAERDMDSVSTLRNERNHRDVIVLMTAYSKWHTSSHSDFGASQN
jgi:hypothetical protein